MASSFCASSKGRTVFSTVRGPVTASSLSTSAFSVGKPLIHPRLKRRRIVALHPLMQGVCGWRLSMRRDCCKRESRQGERRQGEKLCGKVHVGSISLPFVRRKVNWVGRRKLDTRERRAGAECWSRYTWLGRRPAPVVDLPAKLGALVELHDGRDLARSSRWITNDSINTRSVDNSTAFSRPSSGWRK